MKKIKKIAACALFTAFVSGTSLAFAAARPSVDGHAVVADAGAMPRGLFAKTVGYLPGDSVSVTNPYTGTTINVLVLGSIDPSEGVAILLSPEAAERLGIKKDANIQVKITKRVGDVDEAVSGSAVIAESSDSSSAKKDKKAEYSEAKKADETPLVSSVSEGAKAPISEEPEVEELAAPEDSLSETASEIASSDAENDTEKSAENPKTAEPANAVAEAVTDELPPYEAAPAIAKAEEDSAKKTEEELNAVEKTSGRSQNKDAAPVFEVVDEGAPELAINRVAKAEAVDGNAPKLEKHDEAKPVSEAVDGKAPLLAETDEKIASSEAVDGSAPAIADSCKNTLNTEAVTDELPELASPKEARREVVNALPADLMAGAESGAIVLVPAPENPPTESDKALAEATKKAEEERKATAQAYRDRMAAKAAEENAAANTVDNSTAGAENKIADAKSSELKNTESTGFDNYIVPDVDKLSAGYYVQIASLSDKTNIVGIVNTYSSKYPIEIVPSTVKKNSYQIMIGPLGVDEYGTVLERFKSRGYRDSFIRKVK